MSVQLTARAVRFCTLSKTCGHLDFAKSFGPLAATDFHVSPLNNPDPFRSNLGLTEKGSKDEAGGLRRLPLLLFDLGIVPLVDL